MLLGVLNRPEEAQSIHCVTNHREAAPRRTRACTIAMDDATEFVRLQLEVDALLDLPDGHDMDGPTGPEDTYFSAGQAWVRFYFTGSLYTVREYMRPKVRPYAYPSLDLRDCVEGMAQMLTEMRTLDADEFANAADGVFRATSSPSAQSDAVRACTTRDSKSPSRAAVEEQAHHSRS